MSKVFSIIVLSGDYSSVPDFFMPGNPSEDDIEVTDEFTQLVESGETHITASVTSYVYGEGESEPASDEEVEFLSQNFEELDRKNEIDFLSSCKYGFSIEAAQEEYEMDDIEL